jgi:YidC/Oxa1 family membrane protein insertase
VGEEIHRFKPSNFGDSDAVEKSGTLTWAALQTKYFTAIMIPSETGRGTATISGDKTEHRISQRVNLPAVPRQNRVDQSIRVYMGPLDFAALKSYDIGLEDNIEMGWRLIRPISWLVLWSMTWSYKYIPNYGIIIILISILTKILFYRLTHKSFKSMKDLQSLQPKMQALKEKYKEDRQKLSQETMKLYKQAGVNPLGGCFPLLLQMPVFIALFNVLRYTIEVRGAHFVWWITDLSQQDVLFKMPFSLPLIGDNFSLLPILMGVSMLLQTKIGGSITPGSPNPQTPPGFQTMLPIVFTFLFYKMPSGLVLYWLVNTVLSIAQQYYIHKADHKPTDGADDKPAANQKRRLKTKGR